MLQSLSFPKDSNYTHKVVVYVPEDCVDTMRSALADIGVGVRAFPSQTRLFSAFLQFTSLALNPSFLCAKAIGAYKQCAFYNPGVGSWFATDASNPGTTSRLFSRAQNRTLTLELQLPNCQWLAKGTCSRSTASAVSR